MVSYVPRPTESGYMKHLNDRFDKYVAIARGTSTESLPKSNQPTRAASAPTHRQEISNNSAEKANIQKLQLANAKLETDLKHEMDARACAERELGEAKRELAQQQLLYDQLKISLAECENDLYHMTRSRDSAQTQLERFKRECERANERATKVKQSLESAEAEATKSSQRHQDDVRKLSGQVIFAEAFIDSAEQQIDEDQKNFDQLLSMHMRDATEMSRDELVRHQRKVEQTCRLHIDNAQARARMANAEIARVKGENGRLAAELAAEYARFSFVEREAPAIEKSNGDLRAELTGERKRANEERIQLEAKVRDLERQVNEQKIELTRMHIKPHAMTSPMTSELQEFSGILDAEQRKLDLTVNRAATQAILSAAQPRPLSAATPTATQRAASAAMANQVAPKRCLSARISTTTPIIGGVSKSRPTTAASNSSARTTKRRPASSRRALSSRNVSFTEPTRVSWK